MPRKLLFLLLFSTSIYSQTDRTIFFGKISDELGELENVHILNLNTNQATSTNLEGEFKIFAKVKDSLKITSVGYKTKILLLKTTDFGINEKQIKLRRELIELDEVALKKHNLTGNLASDIKLVPKDRVQELVDNAMANVMNMRFGPVIEKMDEIDRMKAPIVNTDPIGGGISLFKFSLSGNTKSKRKRENYLEKKQQLPKKIITLVGRNTIIKEFKISEDKLYHFLDFCSYNKEIELIVDKKEIFKLIRLLKKESIAYHKIVEENK